MFRSSQRAVERFRAAVPDLFAPGKQQFQARGQIWSIGVVQHAGYFEQCRHAGFGVRSKHGASVGLDRAVANSRPNASTWFDDVQVGGQEHRHRRSRVSRAARQQIADLRTGPVVGHIPAKAFELGANEFRDSRFLERWRIDLREIDKRSGQAVAIGDKTVHQLHAAGVHAFDLHSDAEPIRTLDHLPTLRTETLSDIARRDQLVDLALLLRPIFDQ